MRVKNGHPSIFALARKDETVLLVKANRACVGMVDFQRHDPTREALCNHPGPEPLVSQFFPDGEVMQVNAGWLARQDRIADRAGPHGEGQLPFVRQVRQQIFSGPADRIDGKQSIGVPFRIGAVQGPYRHAAWGQDHRDTFMPPRAACQPRVDR